LVKIHMGPTKSCGSHINLVGPMWILTNQKECVKKCVLEGVLLAFLINVYGDKGLPCLKPLLKETVSTLTH